MKTRVILKVMDGKKSIGTFKFKYLSLAVDKFLILSDEYREDERDIRLMIIYDPRSRKQ